MGDDRENAHDIAIPAVSPSGVISLARSSSLRILCGVAVLLVPLLACKSGRKQGEKSAFVVDCTDEEQAYKYAYGPQKKFATAEDAESSVASDSCKFMRATPLSPGSKWGNVEACCPK